MLEEISLLFILFLIILIISIALPTFSGAPWVPSSMENVRKMLDIAEIGPNDVVLDLGCGDGRTIITAARSYGARAIGIEIDPLRYLWCQFLVTILGLRSKVKIIYGNFFNKDFKEATLVTCFLLPETNDNLIDKFKKELRPGTKIVSNTFLFFDIKKLAQDENISLYTI